MVTAEFGLRIAKVKTDFEETRYGWNNIFTKIRNRRSSLWNPKNNVYKKNSVLFYAFYLCILGGKHHT